MGESVVAGINTVAAVCDRRTKRARECEPVLVLGTANLNGGVESLLDIVRTKAGAPIRLTDERWAHISEEHCELAGLGQEVLETVGNPSRIYAGQAGERLAVREVEAGKWLVAVYRELGDDGFVITAFLTRRIASLERRNQLWP